MKLVRAGEFLFFIFSYDCVYAHMRMPCRAFFKQYFPVILIFLFKLHKKQARGLPVQFFCISAIDGSDLYIRESCKLGFV